MEDPSPGVHLRQGGWICAPGGGEHGFCGDLSRLQGVIQIGSDGIATQPACRGGSAATASTSLHAQRRLAVLFFDYVFDVGSAHGVLSSLLEDLIWKSYLQIWTIFRGLTALFRVQHSA